MSDPRPEYDYRFIDRPAPQVTPWLPRHPRTERHELWYSSAERQLAAQADQSPRWVETRPVEIRYRCVFCAAIHPLDSPTLLNRTVDTPCGRGRLRVRLRLDGRYVT